jgi:hypothetical protein
MKKLIIGMTAIAFVSSASQSMAARANTRLGADTVTCADGKKAAQMADCQKSGTPAPVKKKKKEQ